MKIIALGLLYVVVSVAADCIDKTKYQPPRPPSAIRLLSTGFPGTFVIKKALRKLGVVATWKSVIDQRNLENQPVPTIFLYTDLDEEIAFLENLHPKASNRSHLANIFRQLLRAHRRIMGM